MICFLNFLLISVLMFLKYVQHKLSSFSPEPDRYCYYQGYQLVYSAKIIFLVIMKHFMISQADAFEYGRNVFLVFAALIYIVWLFVTVRYRPSYDFKMNEANAIKAMVVLLFIASYPASEYFRGQKSMYNAYFWTIMVGSLIAGCIRRYMRLIRYVKSVSSSTPTSTSRPLLEIVYICLDYIKIAPMSSTTETDLDKFAASLYEVWRSNRKYLKASPKTYDAILLVLTTVAESSNSIQISDLEKANFSMNERQGMLGFFETPAGTVFKSAVAVVEMALYENLVIQ